MILRSYLGSYIWYLDSFVFSPLVWATKESGLELTYVPGKDSKVLRVFDEYVEMPKYEWILIYPEGWLGELRAKRAPKPEVLFSDARVITSNTSVVGLVRFYNKATELQRSQICGTLRSLRERDPAHAAMIKKLIEEDRYPWLRELFAKRE
jgi:hypothetical protein